jgi:hypothetical protein
MDEQAKISDLTVAQFRALMQECFDADRKAEAYRKELDRAVNHYWLRHGSPPPQPWEEWFREERGRARLGSL